MSVRWGDQSPWLLRLMMDDSVKHPGANPPIFSSNGGHGIWVEVPAAPELQLPPDLSQRGSGTGGQGREGTTWEPGCKDRGPELRGTPVVSLFCVHPYRWQWGKVTKQVLPLSFQKILCHIVVWCPSGDSHLLFLSSLPMLWAGMCHPLIQGWSAAARVYLLRQCDLPAITSGLSSRCWCLFRIMWVVSVLGVLKRPWIRSRVSGSGPALPLDWGYRFISWVLICRRQRLAEVTPSSNSLGMCDSRGGNPLLCPCWRCWACHRPTSSRRPPGDRRSLVSPRSDSLFPVVADEVSQPRKTPSMPYTPYDALPLATPQKAGCA